MLLMADRHEHDIFSNKINGNRIEREREGENENSTNEQLDLFMKWFHFFSFDQIKCKQIIQMTNIYYESNKYLKSKSIDSGLRG